MRQCWQDISRDILAAAGSDSIPLVSRSKVIETVYAGDRLRAVLDYRLGQQVPVEIYAALHDATPAGRQYRQRVGVAAFPATRHRLKPELYPTEAKCGLRQILIPAWLAEASPRIAESWQNGKEEESRQNRKEINYQMERAGIPIAARTAILRLALFQPIEQAVLWYCECGEPQKYGSPPKDLRHRRRWSPNADDDRKITGDSLPSRYNRYGGANHKVRKWRGTSGS
jgi:hypothetical protein